MLRFRRRDEHRQLGVPVLVSLTSINIGAKVTSIGGNAFSNCTSLTAITVDALNTAYCSVEGVLFNKSLTALIQYPGGKSGSVTVPASVTSIGTSAFSNCASLTAITVGTLNSNYASVEGVLFNKNLTTLVQCPGGKTGSFTIPSGVTSIGSGAFSNCGKLAGITILASVTSIGSSAFSGCSSLSSVTIPSGVTSIGTSAFSNCASLTAITVATLNPTYSSVDGILFNKSLTALIQCPAGKSGGVTIPASVTSVYSDAFSNCASLTAITVDALNTTYCSVDGILFNKDLTTLIQCPGGKSGEVTVPASVTSIGNSLFFGCRNITT